MFDLDEQVEVAPRTFKRLGDCGPADLRAAADISHRRSEHSKAQAEAIDAGRTPDCDWMNADRSFCGLPAAWLQPSDAELVCEEHGGGAQLDRAGPSDVPASRDTHDVDDPSSLTDLELAVMIEVGKLLAAELGVTPALPRELSEEQVTPERIAEMRAAAITDSSR